MLYYILHYNMFYITYERIIKMGQEVVEISDFG